MSNTITVGFSNDGKSTHYVLDNNSLASELGLMIGSVLGSAFITENVTGGLLSDPYFIPPSPKATGGIVDADYTTVSTYDEAFRFIAQGWNNVKNIAAQASGDDSILFISDNFVQADLDFHDVHNEVELRILDVKRSNILTGDGDDIVRITSATNNSGWSNLHIIHTGDGDDLVVVGKGDAALIPTTLVNFVDGRFTTVEANLAEGNDTYTSSNDHFKSADHIHGGTGSDRIFTGDGKDVLYGDYDFGAVSKNSPGDYHLDSVGDTLSGGAGQDQFHYSNGDGFGYVGDGFDHVLDFTTEDIVILDLNSVSDHATIETATLHTDAGALNGTMLFVNDQAAMFLENFFGTMSEIIT